METSALGIVAKSPQPDEGSVRTCSDSPARRETPKKLFPFISLFHRNLQIKVMKHRNHGKRIRKKYQKQGFAYQIAKSEKGKTSGRERERALRLKALVAKMNEKKNTGGEVI